MRREFAVVVVALLSLPTAPAASDGQQPARYQVLGGNEIPDPLTGVRGDPARGKQIALDRGAGNCLACHALPVDEKLQGDVGPDLNGVGGRLKEGEIRLRVVDPKLVNPQSAMPAFYRTEGLHRVRKELAGKPILTADQVEDVVAYLATLK